MKNNIPELKKTTADALMAYRRMKARLLMYGTQTVRLSVKAQEGNGKLFFAALQRGTKPITNEEAKWLSGWVEAIENARGILEDTYPDKARFMARCFGLDHPIPKRQGVEARITKLALDLHAAPSTLYKWREDILYLTMLGAIETGVLRPFGIGQKISDSRDDQEEVC